MTMFRGNRFTVRSAVVITVVMVFVGFFLFIQKKEVVRLSVADVRKDISKSVPLPSSRDQVEAYLRDRGIEHAYYARGYSYRYTQVDNCEVAMIRNVSSSGVVIEDIRVLFRFDDDAKLVSYDIDQIYTGP